MRLRVPFHRAIQAVAAVTLAAIGIVVPATTAHANTPGREITLITTHNVGIYTLPKVGAKNPIAIDLVPGNSIYAVCWIPDGPTVPGDAATSWYEISGEKTSGGFSHSWAGWVYADYVDLRHAAGFPTDSAPLCGSMSSLPNGVNVAANTGHNVGLYSCPAATNSSTYCLGMKNGPDIPAGDTLLAHCYQYGETVAGSNVWLNVSAESIGARYSAWVLGAYVNNGARPSGLVHCPSVNGTY